jgi:predicted dehydrogenase
MTIPRIAWIGAGNMAQRAHLRTYAQLASETSCQLVGLLDTRRGLAHQVADRYRIDRIYTDIEELLADVPRNIDGICAILPYRQHQYVLPQLLSMGRPLFTEKPLALSVSAGEQLLAIGQSHQTVHMLGYHKRSDASIRHAKALIGQWQESNQYGDLNYIRVTMPPGDWVFGSEQPLIGSERIAYEAQDTPTDVEDVSAYDAFVNYYIHQVNLIRFLLDEPYHVAFGDRRGILLCGESQSGVSIVLEMAPFRLAQGWWEQVLVGFERGFIEVRLPAPLATFPGQLRVVVEERGQVTETQPILPPVSAMRQQAVSFLNVIQGVEDPPCDAVEALEDLRIATAWFQLREALEQNLS